MKRQELLNQVAEIYHSNINNEKAVNYLLQKGYYDKELLDKFKIGFSSEETLLLKNFPKHLDALIKEGLMFKSKTRKLPFDTLFIGHNRIIFPSFDYKGNVVSFCGKSIIYQDHFYLGRYEFEPKYMWARNESKDKKYYHYLYGFKFALDEIKDKKELILMEGQPDVLLSHVYGTKNAVAFGGTSLHNDTILIIKKYADKVIIAFDDDKTGRSEALKTEKLLNQKGIKTEIDFNLIFKIKNKALVRNNL